MTMEGTVLTISDTLDVHPFPLVDGENVGSGDNSIRTRLADTVRQEEKRHRLAEFLSRTTPAWNPDDHPEIEETGGAAEWVRQSRREAEQRFQRQLTNKDQE